MEIERGKKQREKPREDITSGGRRGELEIKADDEDLIVWL